MAGLDLSGLSSDQRPTGQWAAALLHALAREEAAGRRTRRLTEPNLATWKRFRGRLTSADFVALLFDDAAVIHSVPFDHTALDERLSVDLLPVTVADSWLRAMESIDLQIPGP